MNNGDFIFVIWSYLHINVRHIFFFIRFYLIMLMCNLLLITMVKTNLGYATKLERTVATDICV